MKRSFFQAAVVSILLYGCTTWTLSKQLEKKLDDNYPRMLLAISNKSWRQHPTRHQLYGHLSPITKILQVKRTRLGEHCWRRGDELIGDVLLWTSTYGRAKAGQPARTYIQQVCEDTVCSPEDLPEAMNDREKWRERGTEISVLAAWHDDDDDIPPFIGVRRCSVNAKFIVLEKSESRASKSKSSSSSSSSYRTGSTDIPEPLSPLLSIVRRPR